MVAPSGPVATSRIPATAGPRKVPRPSAALEVTLAATSWAGDVATAGSRAMCSGRVNAPTPASRATTANRSGIGRSSPTTTIARPMATVRIAFTARSTTSGRQRTVGRPANGAINVGTRKRASPRMPTATVPPASYAARSVVTRNAHLPAQIANHATVSPRSWGSSSVVRSAVTAAFGPAAGPAITGA